MTSSFGTPNGKKHVTVALVPKEKKRKNPEVMMGVAHSITILHQSFIDVTIS